MNIEIVKILDRGLPNDERLWLKAKKQINLSFYMVLNTNRMNTNTVLPYNKNVFWFPNKLVSLGDNIVLYTRNGTDSETTNQDGTKTHFFFWGNKTTLWNNSNNCAVVLEIGSWETTT